MPNIFNHLLLLSSIFTLGSIQNLKKMHHQNPFVLSFSALFLAFFCHCSATKFTVGDSAGWIIPPYPTYYNNWTHSHFIRAGDSIEFQFDDKFYNLIQVSQQEYDHCTSLEPLRIFNSSPVILPLKEKGVLFFTCSISNYCCLGQKIVISVHEGSSQNPPSPSPSQMPIIISPPQVSPNGSAPQPHGSSGMSSPQPSTGNNTSGGNGGNSPVPSSTQGDVNNAVALVGGRSFSLSLGQVLSVLGAFFGFGLM